MIKKTHGLHKAKESNKINNDNGDDFKWKYGINFKSKASTEKISRVGL